MKIETFQDLIDWTRDVHRHLADVLEEASEGNDQRLAEALMHYVADHEAAIASAIDGFEKAADPKALHTWVVDYVEREPIDLSGADAAAFAGMSFDQIAAEVFAVHNKVLELYRYLLSRSDIPEAKDLLEPLLRMEEHETMRLAQQIGRSRDM
jgi:hypothetical protein